MLLLLDMLDRRKLFTYAAVSLLIAVFFAGTSTHILYACTPHSSSLEPYCVSVEKAVMHPADLASNMQGSLAQLTTKTLAVFVMTLVIIIACNASWTWVKKRHHRK